MKRALIALALASVSTAAYSNADWVSIAQSADKLSQIDRLSVQGERQYGRVIFWVKVTDIRPGTRHDYSVQKWKIFCTSHQYAITNIAEYSGGDQLLGSYGPVETPLQDIIPDTVAQQLEKAVCPQS